MQINDNTFEATVRTIAALMPDHVYYNPVPLATGDEDSPSCLYVHPATDDKPAEAGCIMGKALSILGVSLDDLAVEEGVGVYQVLGIEDSVSERVRQWAQAIQMRQDQGKTWGEAVRLADERYPLS